MRHYVFYYTLYSLYSLSSMSSVNWAMGGYSNTPLPKTLPVPSWRKQVSPTLSSRTILVETGQPTPPASRKTKRVGEVSANQPANRSGASHPHFESCLQSTEMKGESVSFLPLDTTTDIQVKVATGLLQPQRRTSNFISYNDLMAPIHRQCS